MADILEDTVPFGPGRRALCLGALVVLAVAVAPPLGSSALRYVSLETVQFALLAIVLPALLALGAPWRLLGLAPALERANAKRQLHPTLSRAALWAAPALAVLVAWRVPALVDALARHRAVLALEVLSAVPAGVVIWLELLPSPPSVPRLSPVARIPVGAVTMWALWILAYIVGFNGTHAYPAYTHLRHRSLSSGADQQLAAGLLWCSAAIAFLPVLFANLMAFLRREDAKSA